MAESDRIRAVRPLAALVPRLIEPALRRRGARTAALMAYWPSIVGLEMAADTEPTRLTGDRVLYLKVNGGFAAQLQHDQRKVVERINTYFGSQIVVRLAFIQTPVGRRRPPPTPPLEPSDERAVADAVAQVTDDDLRKSLTGLGRAIRRSGRRRVDRVVPKL